MQNQACYVSSLNHPPPSSKSWCCRICLQVASQGWLWMPSALSLIYGRKIGTYVNHLAICKRGNKREIDLICSSNSSHSLNGTACRWQFSRQAWGRFAEVDTVQNKFRSRQKQHARISNKDLVRLARWQIKSRWHIPSTTMLRAPILHRLINSKTPEGESNCQETYSSTLELRLYQQNNSESQLGMMLNSHIWDSEFGLSFPAEAGE